MFKEVMTHMNLGDLSTAGMILFFLVFLEVTFYAMTRHPSQAEQWARIPLTGEDAEPNNHPEDQRP